MPDFHSVNTDWALIKNGEICRHDSHGFCSGAPTLAHGWMTMTGLTEGVTGVCTHPLEALGLCRRLRRVTCVGEELSLVGAPTLGSCTRVPGEPCSSGSSWCGLGWKYVQTLALGLLFLPTLSAVLGSDPPVFTAHLMPSWKWTVIPPVPDALLEPRLAWGMPWARVKHRWCAHVRCNEGLPGSPIWAITKGRNDQKISQCTSASPSPDSSINTRAGLCCMGMGSCPPKLAKPLSARQQALGSSSPAVRVFRAGGGGLAGSPVRTSTKHRTTMNGSEWSRQACKLAGGIPTSDSRAGFLRHSSPQSGSSPTHTRCFLVPPILPSDLNWKSQVLLNKGCCEDETGQCLNA